MLQTLFHIPNQIAGMPVFGFGLLLAAWCVFSVMLLLVAGRRQGFTADTWGYVPLLAAGGRGDLVRAAADCATPRGCPSAATA